ncbi:hypothetical protein [Nonomuraea sp. NPDC048916]|uniref:hypothetical protein n=1 Tax=Nonomuraea sp. NPDC048916 TaxID=3154232 RepID=UPI0033E1B1A8
MVRELQPDGEVVVTEWIKVETVVEPTGLRGKGDLVLFRGFAGRDGMPGDDDDLTEWVPGTEEERVAWLTAFHECCMEIYAAQDERDKAMAWGRWWRAGRIGSRYAARVRRAVKAYQPVQEEIRLRLAAERRRQEEVVRTVAAQQVWRYGVADYSPYTAVAYRDDVTPDTSLSPSRAAAHAPRPVSGYELAAGLRDLRRSGVRRVKWDPAALAETRRRHGDATVQLWVYWVDRTSKSMARAFLRSGADDAEGLLESAAGNLDDWLSDTSSSADSASGGSGDGASEYGGYSGGGYSSGGYSGGGYSSGGSSSSGDSGSSSDGGGGSSGGSD